MNPNSDIFTVSAAAYGKVYLGRVAARYLWIPAIPIVLCGIMALADLRWAIVGLMLLFIVTPAMLPFAWWNALRSRTVQLLIHPLSVNLDSENIIINVYRFVSHKDDENDEEPQYTLKTQVVVPRKSVDNILPKGNLWLLELNTPCGDAPFILLPRNTLNPALFTYE